MSNSQRGDGDGYHPPVEIYGAGDGGSYSYEEAASSSAQHGTSHLTLPSIRSLDLALSHTQQLPADPSQHGDPSPARSYPTETNLASGYSRPVRQESELEVYGAGHTQRILQGQDVAQHHLDRDGRPIDYRSFTQAGRSESPLPSVVTSYDTYEDGNTQRRVSQEQTQRYDHRTTVQTITQVYQTTYPPSHLSYPYQLPSEALQSAHRVPASASYVTPMYHHIGTTGAQYHAPPSYRQQPTSIRPRQMSSHVQAAATSGTAADALSAAELRTQSTEQYRNLSHDALPNTPRLLASSSSEAAGPSRPYIHRDLQHSRPLSTSTRQPSIDKRPPRPSISKPPRALLSDVAQLGNSIVEIIEHCTALSTFARHYAVLQREGRLGQGNAPSAAEFAEMVHRAQTVAHMLDTLRAARQLEEAALSPDVSSNNPRKRSWDAAQDDGRTAPLRMVFETGKGEQTEDQLSKEVTFAPLDTSSKADRTRAERDMELIKRKRHALHDEEPETSPAPRPKKRGPRVTASSPGQCNSCGSRDTPEWRRGPEGPRTLCNACGLHYAKVMKEGGSFATEVAVDQFNDMHSAPPTNRRSSLASSSNDPWTQTAGFPSPYPGLPPLTPQDSLPPLTTQRLDHRTDFPQTSDRSDQLSLKDRLSMLSTLIIY